MYHKSYTDEQGIASAIYLDTTNGTPVGTYWDVWYKPIPYWYSYDYAYTSSDGQGTLYSYIYTRN